MCAWLFRISALDIIVEVFYASSKVVLKLAIFVMTGEKSTRRK